MTTIPLREALYSDRPSVTQWFEGRPHLIQYDTNSPSASTPERYTPPTVIFHARQKPHLVACVLVVASLLNPCQCDDVWNCGCKTPTATEVPYSNSNFASETQTPSPNGNNRASAPASCGGLETLACAAAAILFSPPLNPQTPPIVPQQTASDEHASPRPTHTSPKATMPASPTTPTPTPVLDLPPLVFPDVPGPTTVVPPFSTFTTLAGSGCTCGLTCQCPGCASHHPGSDVNPSELQDCMNCVDQSLHVIDQGATSALHIKSPVLEKFLAAAKLVPPPPTMGGKPVELPKLCCGGSCNCGGACGCSGDCNGCCESETPDNNRNDPTLSPPT